MKQSPHYKWILAAVLLCVSAINYADRTAITAVYPLLKSNFGLDDVAIGALGSLFLWTYAFASPFGGRLGDRVRRGRLVLWSLAGWSLVTLLTGLVEARWQLFTMRALLGLVEAFYMPAAMALLAEYHDQSTRATALSVMNLGNYVGLIGGGAVGGYLGQQHGWRSPLIVLGAVGLALAAACVWLLPAGRRPQAEAGVAESAPLGIFHVPSFAVLAAAGLLTSIGTWIFINWLPLYFHENFGMTLAAAGVFGSSLVSVGAVGGQALGGVLSDRMARGGTHRRMLLHGLLIACAAPMLLAFVFTRSESLIMTALVAYSVLRTAGDVNIIPLLCDIAGPARRSFAFGVSNMLNTVAGGLGVFAAGYLKSSLGLSGVFAALTGILAFDAAMLLAGFALFLKRDLKHAGVL